jgi:predicted GNAT family acetyltransferase
MDWIFENGRIYSVNENSELLAETTFVLQKNREVNIDRTYVNPALRGQGVAGKMMGVVAEFLKERGLKATATCSYAVSWLKKHKELYSDIISNDFDMKPSV